MSYNNVTDLIAALKAMDARVRAAILHDELEEFGKSAEDELVSARLKTAKNGKNTDSNVRNL